jgi:signal transduction histidine kinase
MLSRTTLRTRLILLALIPLVAVFVMAGRSVRADFARAQAASAQAQEVVRTFRVYDIGRALERELLVDRLVAPSAGEEPNQVSPRGLDTAISTFLDDPASADEATIAAVDAFDRRLPALRAALRADEDEIFAALVAARDTLAANPEAAAAAPETPNLETAALEWTAFTRLIGSVQDFDTTIFTDSATTEDALTIEMTASLREAVALQGASFSSLLTSPIVESDLLVAAAEAAARAERSQQDLLDFGSPEFVSLVLDNGGAALSERITAGADEVLAQQTGIEPTVDVTTVRPAYLSADQLLIGAVDSLFGELTDGVTRTESKARSSAMTTLLMLAIMTLVIVLLVIFLYRSIRRPLQRVTERSRAIANVQLPNVVASMRADVDAELPEIEAIPVTSHDEIGELVTAFNLMSATAVGLVGEQAAARRSIADMFMNLGRRNQKLLNRLLRNLDRLERNEEDPDVLAALYDIDHITTRMRRNAESLLVLAGAEQSRSFAKPAPAGDVVRAALAEVENYQRVTVTGDGSQLLTGECVADVAHLTAELIENALAFSPPESMVQVSTRMTPRGYIIVVTDSGVGMSAEKMADSNQRIAAAARQEETPSKFLGLFVVGRLAARRGIEVELFESPSGGVTARVLLPVEALHVERPEPRPLPETVDTRDADGIVGAATVDLPTRAAASVAPMEPVPLLVPPTLEDVPFAVPQPLAAPSEAVAVPVATMPTPASPNAGSPDAAVAVAAEPVGAAPSRPNSFGAPGRQPGANLPSTVVQRSANGLIADHDVNNGAVHAGDGVAPPVRDASTVKRSLASFQHGTIQADQQSQADHHGQDDPQRNIEETAGAS